MKILVVGAGATGGFFGGRLVQAGHDVTFLVRPRRAQQLRSHGLVIHSDKGTVTMHPQIIQAEALTHDEWQLIILAVKNPQLTEVIEQIAPAIGPETLLLPLLNGMGHIAQLQQAFGTCVVGGLCQIFASLNDAQEIEQYTPLNRLVFGPLTPSQQHQTTALYQQLGDVGFTLVLSDDIKSEMWEKWLFLSVLGASTSLARGDTQKILATQGGKWLIEQLFNEVTTIITAAGYQPRPTIVARLLATLTNENTPLVSSLYRDLVAGNRTESSAIIGALITKAENDQLAVPLLAACWVQLQLAEARRQ